MVLFRDWSMEAQLRSIQGTVLPIDDDSEKRRQYTEFIKGVEQDKWVGMGEQKIEGEGEERERDSFQKAMVEQNK